MSENRRDGWVHLVRKLLGTDKRVVNALLLVADGQDKLREELADFRSSIEAAIGRMTKMGQAYQDSLNRVLAEVADERNIFIGAVKVFQAQAAAVKDAAGSVSDEKVAADLNALADQMHANAGPLAAAIVNGTPAAVPPMAPSPADPSGSGDGVSARLPGDPPPVGFQAAAPADGTQRVDPDDPTKTQVYRNGQWIANDGSAAATGQPKEGDTRIDPATGANQRFTSGAWVNI